MEFDDAELAAIERACRAQTYTHRECAAKMDRPIERNQASDSAEELICVVQRIEQDRRLGAQAGIRRRTCDD